MNFPFRRAWTLAIPCLLSCTTTGLVPSVPSEKPLEIPPSSSSSAGYRPLRPSADHYGQTKGRAYSISAEAKVWFDDLANQGYQLDSSLCDVAEDALIASREQAQLSTKFRESLVHWHGRAELEVRFLRLVLGSRSRPQQSHVHALRQSLSRVQGPSRLGLALGQDPHSKHWELVVVQALTRVRIDAFPRRVALAQSLELRGELSPNYEDPVLMITGARGEIHQRAVSLDADQFHVVTRCDQGPGRYQIELAALGPQGPQVLMNVPVYCGIEPPPTIETRVEALDPSLSNSELEHRSVALVNELRKTLGLAPLIWDSRLASSARRHSRDMELLDYVGHESPVRGDFSNRLNRAGIFAEMAFENVAVGSAPREILDRLMASPGHRANILHPQITHFGVGIAIRTRLGRRGQDALFVTQQFARWEQEE